MYVSNYLWVIPSFFKLYLNMSGTLTSLCAQHRSSVGAETAVSMMSGDENSTVILVCNQRTGFPKPCAYCMSYLTFLYICITVLCSYLPYTASPNYLPLLTGLFPPLMLCMCIHIYVYIYDQHTQKCIHMCICRMYTHTHSVIRENTKGLGI